MSDILINVGLQKFKISILHANDNNWNYYDSFLLEFFIGLYVSSIKPILCKRCNS